jgi:hypothetical protein
MFNTPSYILESPRVPEVPKFRNSLSCTLGLRDGFATRTLYLLSKTSSEYLRCPPLVDRMVEKNSQRILDLQSTSLPNSSPRSDDWWDFSTLGIREFTTFLVLNPFISPKVTCQGGQKGRRLLIVDSSITYSILPLYSI